MAALGVEGVMLPPSAALHHIFERATRHDRAATTFAPLPPGFGSRTDTVQNQQEHHAADERHAHQEDCREG